MKLVAAKCPNCGASIDVDKDSDSTKCEYCNNKIIVEDAINTLKIEMSGNVKVSNITDTDKLEKIALRHYNDSEYDDALKKYEKILELDPDNFLIVLRIGICQTFLSKNTTKLYNSIKNSFNLCDSSDCFNLYFNEILDCLLFLYKDLLDYQSHNTIKFSDLKCLKEKYEELLGIYEYVYTLTDNCDILDSIYDSIVRVISWLTSKHTYLSYNKVYSSKVDKNYLNKYLAKKSKYDKEYQDRHPGENKIITPVFNKSNFLINIEDFARNHPFVFVLICWVIILIVCSIISE